MKDLNGAAVLYISYDGLLEPLGESQVLQYLEVLANEHRIVLLTHEKPSDWKDLARRQAFARRLESRGIHWVPRKYHKSPAGLSTVYDISAGIIIALFLAGRFKFQIVHARSYVPALIALFVKRLFGSSFVFDMRGFWPDERVNAGQWTASSTMYKVAKWFEKRFFLAADAVVSLTEAAVNEIREIEYLDGRLPEFYVIPTCTNMSIFNLDAGPCREGAERDSADPFVLGCVGSVGGWFRFDVVLRLFSKILSVRSGSRLVVLNRGQHVLIDEMVEKVDVPQEQIRVVAVDYDSVASEMASMSAGVFFYQPSYSELARSPTKMGEFLSCGVPCVTNRGVGDSERVLVENEVGVVIDGFSDSELDRAATEILSLVQRKSIQVDCVKTAETHFSLTLGTAAYDALYKNILLQRRLDLKK